jgi:DNA-binding NarL/FixJ family response regulator
MGLHLKLGAIMARSEVCQDTGVSHSDEKIRVILVDEREAMREGLRHMLSEDESITVVGEARDGKSALARARTLRPDIILMDVGVRGTSGIGVACSLMEARLPMGIIILADNRKYLAPAIEAGAVGFLPRNISRGHLIGAIRIIHLWRLGLFDNSRSHFALVKL